MKNLKKVLSLVLATLLVMTGSIMFTGCKRTDLYSESFENDSLEIEYFASIITEKNSESKSGELSVNINIENESNTVLIKDLSSFTIRCLSDNMFVIIEEENSSTQTKHTNFSGIIEIPANLTKIVTLKIETWTTKHSINEASGKYELLYMGYSLAKFIPKNLNKVG